MRKFKNLFLGVAILCSASLFLSSCTTLDRSMREPNTRLNLTKSDFSISEQFSAEATSTKILSIDWERLFMSKTGTIQGGSASISIASIPVIGNLVSDKTANFALYELMNANPGYDVVLYPQYETKISKPALGISFIYTVTTVKATARLGKLKN